MSNPFIIFAGNTAGELEPIKSAPNITAAIAAVISEKDNYRFVEAVYMPEDNLDVNEVIYSNCKY